METIKIQSRFGNILFSYEKEDNTVKDTVLEAIRSGVNLRGVDLRGVDLYEVDLREIDLRDADLRGVDFSCANLSGASLSGANLSGANLSGASLRGTNLRGTNLRGAYLRDADLRSADFRGANLRGMDPHDAKNTPFIPMNLPEGEFIAWKKLPNGLIAKLKILEDSKRSRSTSDKCRCDKAMVLEFQNADGTKSEIKEYTSNIYYECKYEVGKIVEADKWDEDRFNECSHGIHFFIDRQSAVDY